MKKCTFCHRRLGFNEPWTEWMASGEEKVQCEDCEEKEKQDDYRREQFDELTKFNETQI